MCPGTERQRCKHHWHAAHHLHCSLCLTIVSCLTWEPPTVPSSKKSCHVQGAVVVSQPAFVLPDRTVVRVAQVTVPGQADATRRISRRKQDRSFGWRRSAGPWSRGTAFRRYAHRLQSAEKKKPGNTEAFKSTAALTQMRHPHDLIVERAHSKSDKSWNSDVHLI